MEDKAKNWRLDGSKSRETSLKALDAVWGGKGRNVIIHLYPKETVF